MHQSEAWDNPGRIKTHHDSSCCPNPVNRKEVDGKECSPPGKIRSPSWWHRGPNSTWMKSRVWRETTLLEWGSLKRTEENGRCWNPSTGGVQQVCQGCVTGQIEAVDEMSVEKWNITSSLVAQSAFLKDNTPGDTSAKMPGNNPGKQEDHHQCHQRHIKGCGVEEPVVVAEKERSLLVS